MDGSAVCFETRVPSPQEIEELPQVVITSKDPWDPTSKPLFVRSAIGTNLTTTQVYHKMDTVLRSISSVLVEHQSTKQMVRSIKVHRTTNEDSGADNTLAQQYNTSDTCHASDTSISSVHASATRHLQATAETLSRKWNIGLDTAQRTMRVTTQQGI